LCVSQENAEKPARSRKRRKQRGNSRIVAKSFADVREAVDIPRAEHKTSAKLKWILSQFVLMMPRGAGALARFYVVLPKEVQEVGVAKFRRAIGLPLLVDQQRKSDARFLAKQPRVIAIAQSDGRQRGSFAQESLLVFAQLRDMLAAEDSSIVPQENQHGRLARPQRLQIRLFAIAIRKHDLSEFAAKRFRHVPSFLNSELRSRPKIPVMPRNFPLE
jgi:hypothetical protein